MKTSQWLLPLFSAVSLVAAFLLMKDGPMPVVFLLIALIASTCAQSLHEIHRRIDRMERKDEKDQE